MCVCVCVCVRACVRACVHACVRETIDNARVVVNDVLCTDPLFSFSSLLASSVALGKTTSTKFLTASRLTYRRNTTLPTICKFLVLYTANSPY